MRKNKPAFNAINRLNIAFFFLCFIAFQLKAQSPNAFYHFDNADTRDYAGSFDITDTTDISFVSDTRDYVRLKEGTGVITLPSVIADSLFLTDDMKISLNVKFHEGARGVILTAQAPISSAFYQNPGFTIWVTHDEATSDSLAVLRFAYADSTNDTRIAIPNVPINTWHAISLVMNLDQGNYKFTLNGEDIIAPLFDGFNKEEFKNAIKANDLMLGRNSSPYPPANNQMDIDELKVYFPAPSTSEDIVSAYYHLYNDLTGDSILSEANKLTHLNTIKTGLPFSNYTILEDSLIAYTQKFEELYSPLFSGNATSYILEENMPIHDQVVLSSQAHVFKTQFVAENVDNLNGLKFEFGELFPGAISESAVRTIGGSVEINGTYITNPAVFYGMQEFLVRPTGYYLAAGDTATVEVPPSCVNQGLSVTVGVHMRDLDESLGALNRPRDISVDYPITSTKTKIANPYGGGIYIKIPDGTDLGWFTATINHAVKSPYFSWRAGRESNVANWLSEVQNSEAPWADFESDKYMFTIPIEDALETQVPDMVMQRWDSIMDAFRYVGGRPSETRVRAEFYIADRKLVTPSYGSGYPLVISLPELQRENSNWNPLTVLEFPPNSILFHEMGHNAAHPTLQYDSAHHCELEAETNIHLPAVYINEWIYGMELDSAFKYSGTSATGLSLQEAAFDWIITNNFRNNIPMSYDSAAPMPDKDQLKYQFRGWAKYIDIARLFSWDSMSQVFGAFYIPDVQRTSEVACRPEHEMMIGREEFIASSSNVLGQNMAPFFHFWGVNPTDSLAAVLSGLPKSQKAKEMIDRYYCEVAPQSLSDYTEWHNRVYASVNYQQPRYDEYLINFDNTYTNAINNQFSLILNKYGLYGPDAPTNVSLNADGLDLTISWDDNSSDETGFIIRYKESGGTAYIDLDTVTVDETSYMTTLVEGSYDFLVLAINADNLESNHCDAVGSTIILEKIDQEISFGPIADKTFGDVDFTLQDTTNAGLIITYTSSDTSVARVTGNTVSIVGAGTTDITASQAGDANHKPANNKVQALTVNPKSVALTITAIDSTIVNFKGAINLTNSPFKVLYTFAEPVADFGIGQVALGGGSGTVDDLENIANDSAFIVTIAPAQGDNTQFNISIQQFDNYATGADTVSVDYIEAHIYQNNWFGKGAFAGTPNDTEDALILSSYTGTAFACNNLNIGIHDVGGDTLKITPNSFGNLIVKGNITNEGFIGLPSAVSLVNYGTITGSGVFGIERITSHDKYTGKYSFMGSPITEGKFSSLGSIIYAYDETIDFQTGTKDGLDNYVVPSTTNMIPGKGYASAFTGTVVFEGIPNTGDVNIDVTKTDYTLAEDLNQEGFNMVSNPYPCALDFNKFYLANTNSGVLGGGIWLWDDNNSATTRGSSSDYITVSMLGVVGGANYKNGKQWTNHIGTAQGFFVRVDASYGTHQVSFADSMKVQGYNADSSFFRRGALPDRIVLSISGNDGSYDESLLGFRNDATLGVDKLYDARKIDPESGLRLFSMINNEAYAIQGLPFGNEIEEVHLGYNATESGTYTIDWQTVGHEFGSIAQVWLRDATTDKLTELDHNNAYVFQTKAGINTDRFTLVLKQVEITQSKPAIDSIEMKAYVDGRQKLLLQFNQELSDMQITLFDLSGNELLNSKQAKTISGNWETTLNGTSAGFYILVIASNEGQIKRKIRIE